MNKPPPSDDRSRRLLFDGSDLGEVPPNRNAGEPSPSADSGEMPGYKVYPRFDEQTAQQAARPAPRRSQPVMVYEPTPKFWGGVRKRKSRGSSSARYIIVGLVSGVAALALVWFGPDRSVESQPESEDGVTQAGLTTFASPENPAPTVDPAGPAASVAAASASSAPPPDPASVRTMIPGPATYAVSFGDPDPAPRDLDRGSARDVPVYGSTDEVASAPPVPTAGAGTAATPSEPSASESGAIEGAATQPSQDVRPRLTVEVFPRGRAARDTTPSGLP